MPRRQPLPAAVARLFGTLPPDTALLAERARALLVRALPKAIETVDTKGRLLGYSYGPGYKGVVATLLLSKQGAKIGLAHAAGLPDPENLLAGAGRVHRHIAFARPDDFQRPGIKRLIAATLAAWKSRSA
ncbi:MAG TPA: DUF1801 domain-containing protein [Gemmatimonadales bacterium]|nr:DUF1801 domain-containing protein [Gemmatimonadales bacterium]